MFTDKKITFDYFIRGVIVLAMIIGAMALINRLSSVLLPFFIAWLIAYLMYPMVSFFQYKLRLKYRIVAILCSFLVIIGVLTAAFFLFVPPVVEELNRISNLLLDYFAGNTSSSNIPKLVSRFLEQNLDEKAIASFLSRADVLEAIKTTMPKLWSVLSESVSLLFSIVSFFIILLYIVFILLDYESISDGWIKIVPHQYRKPVSSIVHDVAEGMSSYFRGQATVAFIVGILFSIGFTIIDFPLAIILGMFIGILNLVPYLQIIGFVPTLLLAVLKAADTGGNFWWILFSALAVFAVVQAIQDGFLVPKIMGKITGLNPAIILLSLSIWGSLLGMIGMIIALPITTIIISYYKRFILKKEN